jgi:hypothetical protein
MSKLILLFITARKAVHCKLIVIYCQHCLQMKVQKVLCYNVTRIHEISQQKFNAKHKFMCRFRLEVIERFVLYRVPHFMQKSVVPPFLSLFLSQTHGSDRMADHCGHWLK